MNPRYSLLNAFENGRDAPSIGYHGTSIETIAEIIATGKQPGSTETNRSKQIDLCVRKGDIFFYPIKERCPVFGKDGAHDEKTAFERARIYAETTSRYTAFKNTLKLPPSLLENSQFSYELEQMCCDFAGNEDSLIEPEEDLSYALRILRFKGHTNKSLTKKLVNAHTRNGIVLGYSASVLDKNPLPGNDGHDLRVKPIYASDIVGVIPLDSESENYFKRLARKK